LSTCRTRRCGSPSICTSSRSSPTAASTTKVDATAQFLDWFKSAAREDGIYAYYRMRYEERRRREGAPPV
jgi:hypothetical protein